MDITKIIDRYLEKHTYLDRLNSSQTDLGMIKNKGVVYAVDKCDWPWLNMPSCRLGSFFDCVKSGTFGECSDFNGLEFIMLDKLVESKNLSLIIDAGANYARESIRYSLFLKNKNLTDKIPIVGFEPGFVRNIARLNIDINYCNDVIILPHALFNKQTFIEFGTPNSNSLGGSATNIYNGWTKTVVPTLSLDCFFKELCIEGIVFIKFDLQGGEYHALLDFCNYLDRVKICGILEFVPQLISKHIDVYEYLKDLLNKFNMIDLGCHRNLSSKLDIGSEHQFIDQINQLKDTPWTDMLFWDKRIPFYYEDFL